MAFLLESFTFADGRSVTLLAGGEMLNLAAGGGNPAETMDMGLSLQARSLALVASGERLAPGARARSGRHQRPRRGGDAADPVWLRLYRTFGAVLYSSSGKERYEEEADPP